MLRKWEGVAELLTNLVLLILRWRRFHEVHAAVSVRRKLIEIAFFCADVKGNLKRLEWSRSGQKWRKVEGEIHLSFSESLEKVQVLYTPQPTPSLIKFRFLRCTFNELFFVLLVAVVVRNVKLSQRDYILRFCFAKRTFLSLCFFLFRLLPEP